MFDGQNWLRHSLFLNDADLKNTKEIFLKRGTFDLFLCLTRPSIDYKSTLTPGPASRWDGGGDTT